MWVMLIVAYLLIVVAVGAVAGVAISHIVCVLRK
jgi:hypothetical protein